MNQDDYIKSLTAGASTPAAAAPQEEVDNSIWGLTKNYGGKALDLAAIPGRKINEGLGKLAEFGGSPMGDAPISQQFGSVLFPEGHNEVTDPFAGITNIVGDISPKAQKYYTGVGRPVAEFGGQLAVDPLTYGGLSLLNKAGKAGSIAHAGIGAGFTGVMTKGVLEGGREATKIREKEGFSPAWAGKMAETGLGTFMAAQGAKGTTRELDKKYVNRSGKEAAGDARAPFPSDHGTSTSGTTPADVSAPRVNTPNVPTKGTSTAGMFSIPDPSAIKAPPLRSKIEGVAERANQVLNETIAERTKRANEGVEAPADYEIDASEMMTPDEATKAGMTDTESQRMPDTFGGGFNEKAAKPTKIKVLDEATIQQFEKQFPGEDVRGTSAFQHGGTIYIGEGYSEAVLNAKTPAEAISNAIGLIAHERMHGTQRADKYTADTARYNPLTGDQLPAEIKGPDGSMIPNPHLETRPHARGGFNDNILRDVEGAIRARGLEQAAEADPRMQALRARAESDPALAAGITGEGKLPGGGTYTPEVSQLAEGLAGEALAPGGRSWSEAKGARPERTGPLGMDKPKGSKVKKAEKVEAASKEPVNEERVKNIGEIIAQRFGAKPSRERASAVKAYLDGAVEHSAITPSERSAAYKAYKEAISAPPNPAAGKADELIARAKAESEAQPVEVSPRQAEVDEAHERALRPAQPAAEPAPPIKDAWARGNKHNKPDYVSRTEWLQKISDMGGPTAENLAKIGSSPAEYAARRKDVTSSRNTEYDRAREILSEHARQLRGRVLGKGASLRELGLNRRRLSKELAGEDTSNLPKSSQDLSSPAATVRGIQEAVVAAKAPFKNVLKQGSGPEVKKAAASRLGNVLKWLRGEASSVTGLSAAQARDINNQVKGVENLQTKLEQSAESDIARAARVTEQLRIKEYKEAQARERERIVKEGKAEARKTAVNEGRVKEATVDEVASDEDIEFASPEEKRLTVEEAAREAKTLAEEVKIRTAKLRAEGKSATESQDYFDKLSIAKRDTDAGKKSRSGMVTKTGEIFPGKDIIGKAARDLKAGKKKVVVERVPQGRKIATAADVAEWNAKRKKGGKKLSVGDPIPGTEAYSGPGHLISSFAGHGRGSIVKGREVLGEVMEGKRMGQTRGDEREVAQRKVTTTPGTPAVLPRPPLPEREGSLPFKLLRLKERLLTKPKPAVPAEGHKAVTPQKEAVEVPKPEVPEAIRQKRAAIKARIDARKEAARVAALERIKVGSVPQPRPSGVPKLTEGPISRIANRIIPKAFQRKGLEAVSGASKKAFEAERQVLIANEILKNKTDLTSTDLIDSAVKTGRISRASAMELRGLNRTQLEEFAINKVSEAAAYRNANVAQKEKDPAVYEAGKRKYVEQAVKEGMEQYNLHEDQLHADGRLHTVADEMRSRKLYKGGFRDLVEDFTNGIEIDPDNEYFVNPRDRATLKKALADKAWRDYDAEMASSEEAPVYAVRPELAARLGKRAPQSPQTMPAGGTNKLTGKGSGPETEAARITREAEGRPAPTPRTPENTAYKTARYPTLEAWANANRPERALALSPKKAQRGARKPGTEGTEGHGDVERAMEASDTIDARTAYGTRSKSGFESQSGLLSKTSSTGKIYEKAGGAAAESEAAPEGLSTEEVIRWMKEHRVASLEKRAARKLENESSREAHAQGERLTPRLGEGKRKLPPAIRNYSTIKNLIGQIARETVGKGAAGREEFMSRIDDLIKKRVEAKDILPGETTIKVRKAALDRFNRERTAAKPAETPRERAERILGGEQIEGASPVLGRKKRAEQGDVYAQAGEESYAKVPLNKTAEKGRRALGLAEETSGVMKNLQTGFDVSATFRNTLALTARQMAHDPAGFVKNFHKMVTSYSEKKFNQHVAQIEAQPEWQEALDSGLRLSKNASDHDLFQKTDHVANWIKAQTKSPHLIVRALAQIPEKGMLGAARAYTMYQNAVMLDAFKAGKKMLAQEGNITPSKIREMNTVINMLGNRHQPSFLRGKENETWARAANTALYSPNMIASAAKTIVNLGIPAEIGPRVLRAGREFESVAARKMFQQSMRSTMGFGTSVLALTYFAAQSAGLKPEIETDPVSNDFGTVRFGHTKVNPWGPYQQYIRMGAQIATGKEKLRGSGRVQKTDISKIVSRWIRGKLSPLAGAAWSIGSGSTGAGRETASVKGRLNVLSELASPINLGDVKDIAQENPPALAAYLASLSTLGITVQSGTGTKPWISDPDMSATDVRVSDEIRRLKLEPPRINSRVPLKGRNAVGQKLYYSLSREEREKFTDEVMPIISKDIDTFIASDRYKNATEAVKKKLLFRVIKRENARYSAAKRLKKTYAGATPVNDWWKDEED